MCPACRDASWCDLHGKHACERLEHMTPEEIDYATHIVGQALLLKETQQ